MKDGVIHCETPWFLSDSESSHVRPGLQVLDLFKKGNLTINCQKQIPDSLLKSHNACELHQFQPCSWLDERCKICHRRRRRKTFGAAMLLIDGGGLCRPLCELHDMPRCPDDCQMWEHVEIY